MRAEREDEGLAQGTPRDMRGHYPAGLAESVRVVRAYRAEHPESADVLDRLNRAVYSYRRNNGWNVPLLSREGERLQGGRTALPDDGASEAVVGGGRGLPRALPAEDKGLAQGATPDVRQGLTQSGRGLTPDAGADANAAALQGLPESAAVASGNAPTHQQNLQVRSRAEGAAPGLAASENLAETDGGKRAPVAGKRPDTVLPVLNPEKAAGNIRRGRAAMNRALVEKADVRRAMYRNDIGWIDFVWGSTGRVLPNGKTKGAMGLAHVIESRMRKDGMSRDEVAGMLIGRVVDTIAKGGTGKIYRSGNSESMFVEYNGNRATLVKNKGSNGWLMNAFELHQNDDAGKSNDSSASTHKQATRHPLNVGASDTPNVRAKDESVNTADGTRFGRAAGKVSPKKRMADAAADFTRRLAADRRKLEKAGVPLGDGEYRFEHTNRKHVDALAGVLDRLGKGGMLEEFADMAGSSNSDGLVFDGRRYLKGREAETLQAGGLLEAVPSKSGWDYRLTQEGRALAKVMARSRDAAADGKPAGRAQAVKLATDELDAVRGNILFSLDESPDSAFARAVDDAARGRQVSGYVRVGTTPDVLKMLGLPDVRVTVHGSMFKKVMGGKHSVTAEDLKQIPKQINSPVAVMKSETMADGYVVLTELVEHERGTDKPVVAALHLKRTKDGLELMNIASVYGRRDIQVQRGLNSHLLYLDKEKGLKLSRTFGLQLPAYVQEGSNLGSQVKTDSDLAQYLKAENQGKFDKKQENAKQHAESIKKRLAESIGGLAEQVDVAAVSETAPDKAQMLLSERVEGWFDGRTGKITLVAENLTPERAVWAAWHELGHRGFAADGFAKYREELERADGNSLIRRIADAVQEEREGRGDAAASVRSAAVEEAIVELYAAQRTGDWSGIENRYGVKVGNGLKRGIAGVLARIGALLRRVLQRLTGKADGAMSDADVFAMLADLHGNAEGARDAVSDGNHRAVMFARAEDGAAERSKSESLEKLRRAETIRISGREIEAGDDLRQYKRNALAYGKSLRGSYVNRDTGREISLGRSGITEILRHDYKNPEHLQSIAAIPQIIENAVYIDTLPNEDLAKNGDVQGYEYYVSGLNIGGTDYTVRAAVAVSRNGNRYYDHKLTQIEKGNLLSLLDRVSTTGASESKSPLSDIDDKRLLQILQDKNAGKGGIADFDTEAVRFSRAANIGAAIGHITGKKSDLRNALKDRWDASKGIQLQFLGRRQIEDIYGGSLDGLKEYGRLSELFGADANKAVTEADKVVREWGRLKKEDAKALADLMHDATLAKVDADPLMRGDAQKRLDGIWTALDIADGKIEKARAVIASADARIARAEAAYNKAQRAAELPSRYSRIGRKSCRLYGRADTK